MDHGPQQWPVSLTGEDLLAPYPALDPARDILRAQARLAGADYSTCVVLRLQESWHDIRGPLMNLGRLRLVVDDRGEVTGPRLARHELLQVGEGLRGLEGLVALRGELGGRRLEERLYLTDRRGGIATLARDIGLRPAIPGPAGLEL